jgi:hypothetical protein
VTEHVDPAVVEVPVEAEPGVPADDALGPVDVPVEVPEADAVEQARAVTTGAADPAVTLPESLPLDADPADVADQAREVDLGDDEYR